MLPYKERICLEGHCVSDDDCAFGDTCVTPSGADLGVCSHGRDGSPCLDDIDCFLGCAPAGDGALGQCASDADCVALGGTCSPSNTCPSGTDLDAAKCPDFEWCCR